MSIVRSSKVANRLALACPAGFQQKRFYNHGPPQRNPDRPISPHVGIYKFPVTAVSSVLNRGCGLGLSVGIVGFSVMALGGSCDIPAFWEGYKHSYPLLVGPTKAVVAFPFVYHYIAGARHLYWDATTSGLTAEQTDLSSKVVLGAAAAATLGLAVTHL